MSYGLEIRNSDGNIIIDTVYPNTEIVSSGTFSSSVSYPGVSGFDEATDLLFVAPNDTNPQYGYVNVQTYIPPNVSSRTFSLTDGVTAYPTSLSFKSLRPSVSTPSNSEYGLEVFDENGNLTFTSLTESVFQIVAGGNFVCTATNLTPVVDASFDIPTGDNITDYFVLVNHIHYLDLDFLGNIQFIAQYRYDTNKINFLCNITGLRIPYLIGKLVS
jgi:hypothetical protein